MNNIVIKDLLLQYFEKETIDSFYKLRGFPGRNVGDYLEECCSATSETCKRFWKEFERYKIWDLLPSDNIIQEYMTYLDGERVDGYILDEIKEYEKRLMTRLEVDSINKLQKKELSEAISHYNNRYFRDKLDLPFKRDYNEERPPFPLLDMYYDIVLELQYILETKINHLYFEIVSELGAIAKSEQIGNLKQLDECLSHHFIDYSLAHMVKDKKFFRFANPIKDIFELGYKQFLYYHNSHASS